MRPAGRHYVAPARRLTARSSASVGEPGGFVERIATATTPTGARPTGATSARRAATPSLFVFAYDWRKDNTESAAQLADYIGCACKFFPSGKVNIVTHSMRSLAALLPARSPGGQRGRRPRDHDRRTVLGAPKLVYALQTGDFAPFRRSSPLRHDQAHHAVVPGDAPADVGGAYHQVSGQSVFLEEGLGHQPQRRERRGVPSAGDGGAARQPDARPVPGGDPPSSSRPMAPQRAARSTGAMTRPVSTTTTWSASRSAPRRSARWSPPARRCAAHR